MITRFLWQFPADHPALAGHFPLHPIAPGVLLLDRLTLFAAELTGAASAQTATPTYWCVKHAKFQQTVAPGDNLVFLLQPQDSGGFSFRIERDSFLIARGTLSTMP